MNIVPQKTCSKCRQSKPLDEFPVSKIHVDNRYSSCKACHNARNKAYYAANREKVIERTGRYQREHPEISAKKVRMYYERHAENLSAMRVAASRRWRRKNLARDSARSVEWARNHPDQTRVRRHRRIARVRQMTGTFTEQQWQALKKQYEYRCLRCHRQEPEISLSVDHVVPVTQGGTNDISNIQPLCRACNASKGNRHATDYRTQRVQEWYKQEPMDL